MALTQDKLALLRALDDNEWRMVNHRLGNFYVWTAKELVREGLAESRERERKAGAHLFRRTAAGRAAVNSAQEANGSI